MVGASFTEVRDTGVPLGVRVDVINYCQGFPISAAPGGIPDQLNNTFGQNGCLTRKP